MKIDYTFTAKTKLYTGSDEQEGMTRRLRREKVLLQNAIRIKSKFSSNADRMKALMDIIYPVYSAISPKLKSDYYGFYETYSYRIKTACGTQTKNQFLNRLLDGCGIAVLPDGSAEVVRLALDKFSDEELLMSMRENHQYLMILLRDYVSHYKNKNVTTLPNIIESSPNIENLDFTKFFESVPYFGGNSIRGLLRRLVMYDFTKLAEISKLEKMTYHQLFTGGIINQSTGFEDIAKREKMIEMCPMLGLFGSAIGNMTIEGELKVIGARLQCVENNSGEVSMWELTENNFGTRLDSSKTENDIEITGEIKEASQMIYQYECFVAGSKFNAAFILTTDKSLLISAFWRMIKLWKKAGYIGGMSARDTGIIDIHIEIPDNADTEYLEYIEKNKSEIKAFFDAR